MFQFYILIDKRLVKSTRRYQTYSGSFGALQSHLLRMRPETLARLTATSVQKISA